MAESGSIIRNKETGQLSVLEKDGSRTPFNSIEEARKYRSTNYPEPARTFSPESSRTLGKTFGREFVGGAKQFGRGVLQATAPGLDVGGPPTLEGIADLPLGALRMVGAPLMEAGVQAGRAVEHFGPSLGMGDELSRRVGQVTNLLTQLLPTPGRNIPRFTADVIRNLKPFVKGLIRKQPEGGIFRRMAQQSVRSIQQPPRLPGNIEEGMDLIQESGQGFLRTERRLSNEIGRIIGNSLGEIPQTALRPNTSTRRAASEALEILGTKAKRGELARPTERLTEKARQFATEVTEIPISETIVKQTPQPGGGVLLEPIEQQLVMVTEGARESSIQALDELRKVVGEAIGVVNKRGDRRAALGLGKVLDGIRNDMTRFSDEFPNAVNNLRRGHRLFKERVVPLRRFSGLRPSQVVDNLMTKTPEELLEIRKALPPEALKEIGDGTIERLIQSSFDSQTGFFEPTKFLGQLTGKNVVRLRQLVPDRFADLMALRTRLQKVTPEVEGLQRKGQITRAFGIAQIFRGFGAMSPRQIVRGATATLAPTVMAKLAQTRGGLKLLGQIATTPPGKEVAPELIRKVFSVLRAAQLEAEREGLEIPSFSFSQSAAEQPQDILDAIPGAP